MNINEIQSGESLRILAIHPSRKNTKPLFNEIKKQLPKGSKLILAGNIYADIVMSGLIRVKRKRGLIKNLIMKDRFSGNSYIPSVGLTTNESAFIAIDHLQRRTEQFTWRYHTLVSTYDSKNYYHIVFDLLQNYLTKEQINVVLFFDFPHLFYDTLIYQIAKAKDIRTFIFFSSKFSNRFFSLAQIEDVGIIPLTRSAYDSYPIDPNENPEWEYMKGISQFWEESGKLHWRGVLRLLLTVVAVERKLLLNPKVVSNIFRRMRKVAGSLPKWRDPFRRHFHTSHLDYYERILLNEKVRN